MIQARGLTKKYGEKLAVDGVSFDLEPGTVTGFLGPNGAGKSTTMRMILGLDKPTEGTVTVCGKPYAEHESPLSVVGSLLDAKGVHPGRSARNHLRALAASNGIGKDRVEEVLEITGISGVANRRVGGFSLGMGQRLGIATALLGDPQVLILDEPVNGLDPEGVIWVRQFVRNFASLGRTVLISSHLMSEMAKTADRVIVLGRGKVIADAPIDAFVNAGQTKVRVVSPEAQRLVPLLKNLGGTATIEAENTLTVQGVEPAEIGKLALDERALLHELTPISRGLEEAYMELTRDQVEYHTLGPKRGSNNTKPVTGITGAPQAQARVEQASAEQAPADQPQRAAAAQTEGGAA